MEPLSVVVVVAVVAVVAVILGVWLVPWAQRRAAADDVAPTVPELGYLVPAGQDPAVVLTALAAEGYTATTYPRQTDLLHIACPSGRERDRAHLRATIAAVHTSAIDAGVPLDPGPVRFVDER